MKKIIIADDSALARMFTIRCMEVAGIHDAEYIQAKDGQEVLDLMKEFTPDLLISDLNMPKINGMDLVHHIRSTPQISETPIVIITSAGNSEQRKELIALEVKAILSKPISPKDIIDTITSLLDEGELFYG